MKKKKYNKDIIEKLSSTERLEIQIKAMGDISTSVAGVSDLGAVLSLTVEKIIGGWGLKMPSIYLIENDFLGLQAFKVPKAILKTVEASIGGRVYEKVGYSLSEGENILVKAINKGEILEATSLYDFVRPVISNGAASILQRVMGLKVMMAIPLQIKGDVFGVMAVSSVDKSISDLDKKGIEAIANQISIAIYNARLFSRVQKQVEQLDAKSKDLQSLFEMSKAAIKKIQSEDTVQEILDSVPQQFSHLEYIGAGFFTYDENDQRIKVHSMTSGGVFEKLTGFKVKDKEKNGFSVTDFPESIFSKSLTEKDYLIFDDFSQLNPALENKKEVAALQKELGIKSGILLRIFLRGLIPGVLLIATKKDANDFSERDTRIANSLANNFSLAYENAQLYQKTVDQLQEVKAANEELRRLDEAKTNFVSIASHQLRTPVSGVRGYMSMLYEGDFGQLDEKQREILQMNLANLDRLNKLIDTFLDVTKIEAGKLILEKELCNLSEIIESVVQEFDHQVSVKGIELAFVEPEEPSHVLCDPERIRHAIANLIDNSIKYTPQGRVEVSLTIRQDREIITVRDTGVGIKPAEAERLFDKFVRASGGARINANGSGLGLYIVKKIVEGHDGKVWVESEGEGKGSEFHIELVRTKNYHPKKAEKRENKKNN